MINATYTRTYVRKFAHTADVYWLRQLLQRTVYSW